MIDVTFMARIGSANHTLARVMLPFIPRVGEFVQVGDGESALRQVCMVSYLIDPVLDMTMVHVVLKD